jgi:hypothetical protein
VAHFLELAIKINQDYVNVDLDLINRVKDIKNKSRFFNASIREKLERIETFIKEANEIE